MDGSAHDFKGSVSALRRLLGLGAAMFLLCSPAMADKVPQLPEGNLLSNPWFHAPGQPFVPSLDGWEAPFARDAEGNLVTGIRYSTGELGPVGWHTSAKFSNPSPYMITGAEDATSARFARWSGQGGGGCGNPNTDAYMYQIVSADSNMNTLRFFTHLVIGDCNVGEVNIYGSDSADGEWDTVWTPFRYTKSPLFEEWVDTGFMERTLDAGYDFYKIEFHHSYPANKINGMKVTGVYFTALPEPTSLMILLAGTATIVRRKRGR